MLKKNKSYKEIAAAYMKTIKPRKDGEEKNKLNPSGNLTARPEKEVKIGVSIHSVTKAPEEGSTKKTPGIVDKSIDKSSDTKNTKLSSNWANSSNKIKENSISNILKKARSEQYFDYLEDKNNENKDYEFLKNFPQEFDALVDDLKAKMNKNVK